MLKSGDSAPAIQARNQHGVVISPDFEKPTVVYFYVEDGTPGCATQVDQFVKEDDAYADGGVAVYGVSTDTVESHLTFAQEHDVDYDLLADPDGVICDAFGVPRTHDGRAERTTFVLTDGEVWAVYTDVSADGHARRVLMDMLEEGLTSL